MMQKWTPALQSVTGVSQDFPRADIQDRQRGVRRKVFPDKIDNAFCFRSGNKYIRGDDKIQAIELLAADKIGHGFPLKPPPS